MAKGRPKKRARATYNISGLRNQSGNSSAFSESASQPTPPRSEAPSPGGDESDLEEDDEDLDLLIHFDSSIESRPSLPSSVANGSALSRKLAELAIFGAELSQKFGSQLHQLSSLIKRLLSGSEPAKPICHCHFGQIFFLPFSCCPCPFAHSEWIVGGVEGANIVS
jgi:hypothetical protein